jgi:hypothetical protein
LKKNLMLLLPLALALLALLALPLSALAHGVVAKSGRGGQSAWAQCSYDNGEPMSFASVKIKNPGGRTHQVGHADREGRFAWFPADPGTYTAIFEDGMGHRGQAELAWSAAPAGAQPQGGKSEEKVGSSAVPMWGRAAWGLSAIFWLSGLFFWIQGRRLSRRGNRVAPASGSD